MSAHSPETEPPAVLSEPEGEIATPESADGDGGPAPTERESPPEASAAPENETTSREAALEGETAAPETAPTEGAGGAAEEASDAEAALPADPQLEPLVEAMRDQIPLQGKVIGWNKGGFHVLIDPVAAFCPRSEMETGRPKAPKSYLDRTFRFQVLRIEEQGRRVVLSRAAVLRAERAKRRRKLREKIVPGAVLSGRVASLTDFGAFVDLGGVQGLVHVSELSRQRVGHPSEAVSPGQKVRVKVLKTEHGGRRVSLSMKALEPDPWAEIKSRFVEGSIVKGTVEKVAPFGAFVVLEPGLTGLLPSSGVSLPRGTSLARMYPPGKELSVQILRVDPRRKRISLALEGSSMEGTQRDFELYKRKSGEAAPESGFNALAAALRKAKNRSD